MKLLAFGLNHTVAPLGLREQLSFSNESFPGAVHDLRQSLPAQEVVIVSTCNRTEIYCDLPQEQKPYLLSWLCRFHRLPERHLNKLCYGHTGETAVQHLFRVVCGLDSMVLGEPQILGQIKEAYQRSINLGMAGKVFNRLFQHAFRVAKAVRGGTEIGKHPVSISFVAVKIAQQIFGDLSNKTALIVGSGETASLTAKYLHQNALGRMVIANRSLAAAQHLADKFSGYAIRLEDLPLHLQEADVVITSTASHTPIISAEMAEQRAHKKRHVYIIDLGVPRNVAPEVGQLENIFLYTLDDLGRMAKAGWTHRVKASKQAEQIVIAQTRKFTDWVDSLAATATIQSLHEYCHTLQQEVLTTYASRCENATQQKILADATRLLMRKIIHEPGARLKGLQGDHRDVMCRHLEELFSLEPGLSSENKDDPDPNYH